MSQDPTAIPPDAPHVSRPSQDPAAKRPDTSENPYRTLLEPVRLSDTFPGHPASPPPDLYGGRDPEMDVPRHVGG